MKHAPGAGSLARSVDPQSIVLPQRKEILISVQYHKIYTFVCFLSLFLLFFGEPEFGVLIISCMTYVCTVTVKSMSSA